MLPLDHPDRIDVAFDDHRLVANAGLILPVTLAQHLGLRELVDNHVDLGDAPGRANTGDKMLTLVASALTTPTCCAPAGRPAPSAAWSRRHPRWGRSCAAFGGAISAVKGGRCGNPRKPMDQAAGSASSWSTSPLWQCRYLRPFRHGQGLLGPWFCFL